MPAGVRRERPRARTRLRDAVGARGVEKRERVRRAWLIYDGDCPFCSNYAQYLRVKEAVDELVLVNAREGGPLVDEVRGLPHDLD